MADAQYHEDVEQYEATISDSARVDTFRNKLNKAANELEDLATIAKLMVTDLREGKDNPYGRVYWLRKQLGYTVARLGVGVPKGLDAIETEYEKQLPI